MLRIPNLCGLITNVRASIKIHWNRNSDLNTVLKELFLRLADKLLIGPRIKTRFRATLLERDFYCATLLENMAIGFCYRSIASIHVRIENLLTLVDGTG